jgi:hypothetical protein
MIDNAKTTYREDALGATADSCLVAFGGCLDRPELKMNDRIKRLFKASSLKLDAKEVQRDKHQGR